MIPRDLPDHDCFAEADAEAEATDRTKKRIAYAFGALWLVAVVAGLRAADAF